MGGVEVFWIIRVLVMVPVMSGPPKRTSLSRACAKNRKEELSFTAGFKCFMGEVPVIKPGY